jgi:hypothetical protein
MQLSANIKRKSNQYRKAQRIPVAARPLGCTCRAPWFRAYGRPLGNSLRVDLDVSANRGCNPYGGAAAGFASQRQVRFALRYVF